MGEIEGLERVRFTSPHPAAFTEDVIEAMAETPNVMPTLHMPLQSGSDTVLKAMRRSYRSKKYLGILDRVRELIPNAAITTDIIVGFPGETEQDFEDTMRVVEQSRFQSAFTFQYSIRPGTPAATMEDQLPKEVVQRRYVRLLELQERISLEENHAQIGRTVQVLVSGEGRKDGATRRLSGRAEDNRLVHFTVPAGQSILDCLIEHGCDPMFDCKRGECGVCAVPVIEGEIDHRDYVLTAREKAQGNVMQICISRAKGARLVLDL